MTCGLCTTTTTTPPPSPPPRGSCRTGHGHHNEALVSLAGQTPSLSCYVRTSTITTSTTQQPRTLLPTLVVFLTIHDNLLIAIWRRAFTTAQQPQHTTPHVPSPPPPFPHQKFNASKHLSISSAGTKHFTLSGTRPGQAHLKIFFA